MSAGKEKGGGAAPPDAVRSEASGCLGKYHGPTDPPKANYLTVEGRPMAVRGKRGAFVQALMSAGSEGVAHAECMPWLLNPGEAASALNGRGLHIEARKGCPTRWVLLSDVREVQP